MNVVFTKRDDEPVLLIYENLMFHCEKEYGWDQAGNWAWNGKISLFAHDEMTATLLCCCVGAFRGRALL